MQPNGVYAHMQPNGVYAHNKLIRLSSIISYCLENWYLHLITDAVTKAIVYSCLFSNDIFVTTSMDIHFYKSPLMTAHWGMPEFLINDSPMQTTY